jgi:hypothetical protein
MVEIEVIILRRRTPKQIAAWRFIIDPIDPEEQWVALYGDEVISPEEAWRRLAFDIHERACDASRESPYSQFQVDVFLLVRGRLLEHLYDRDELEKIVSGARYHTWGGNIYLAWIGPKDTDFKTLYSDSEVELEDWFNALVNLGITDLIEIEEKYNEGPEINKILYRSARRSEKRLESLRGFVSEDAWRVILRREAFSTIEAFIKKLVGESTEGRNQAIYFERPPSLLDLAQMLNELHGPEGGGHLFIAVHSRKVESGLEALLKIQFPGEQLFYFNSTLEWLYSFIRLNPAKRPGASGPRADHAEGDAHVQWVIPGEGAGIRLRPNTGDLRLLVTSAFHFRWSRSFGLDREQNDLDVSTHWLHATTEIGEVISRLPFHIHVEVHHDITCERLPRILEDKSFTAWLHLGHGKRGKGLKEEQTGQFVSIERWEGCFRNYEGSLQLVVFSACESAEVAEAFARLGVPVAIGFEEEVLTSAAQKLSAMVIPAALQKGDRQAHVLEAFRAAVVELGKLTYTEENQDGAREDKRYGAAGPKAFAAKLKPQ